MQKAINREFASAAGVLGSVEEKKAPDVRITNAKSSFITLTLGQQIVVRTGEAYYVAGQKIKNFSFIGPCERWRPFATSFNYRRPEAGL
ncbi:MAG: hypothetical protein IPM25_08665 [Chloracidobacterium sp.]|nr:hypothetical protein [Chloracidobacterium sp.]